MDYRISIVRCQGAAPAAPTTLRVGTGGCTIGRSPDSDLPLDDPERVVSGRHARLEVRDAALWVTDLSTNGTYLNGAPERLPPHQAVRLTAGDCLTIGPYELAVGAAQPAGGGDLIDLPGLAGGPQPDILDLLGSGGPGPARAPAQTPFPDAMTFDSLLGAPAAPAEAALAAAPPTPFEHVHVRAPQVAPAPGIADDHDLPAAAGLDADPFSAFGGAPPARRPGTAPPVSDPFAGPHAAADPFADLFAEEPPPRALAPQDQPAAAVPGPSAAPGPDAVPNPAPSAAPPPPIAPPLPQTGNASAEAAKTTEAAPPPPQRTDPTLAAFLAGLGTGDTAAIADPERLLRESGRLLRVLIQGLTTTMHVRAEFKSQLGLGVTILRAADNNPFKFSVDVDEALERLLIRPGGGYLPAVEAARGAFEDIQAHEMALIDSLRAALRALLARFEPAALEQRLGHASGLDKLLPMARRARYWDLFTETYDEVARDAADGFMELFNDAFTRAYEDQIRRLAQARRTHSGGRGP